ncbi:MAG TPA: ATP-binding protein [Anaerolineales bacterium]|nr:ATP-binding protein [Anaerolineales bacterium]
MEWIVDAGPNTNMSDRVQPCPGGFYGDTQKTCTCVPVVVPQYQKRISGHLLDRIDNHFKAPRVAAEVLHAPQPSELDDGVSQKFVMMR